MTYDVVISSRSGMVITFTIDADSPGTALQVAASRERNMRNTSKMGKFLKRFKRNA